MKDCSGAVEDYSRAIEINPVRPESWFNRAKARYHLNDTEGFISDLKQAAALGFLPALNQLMMMKHGSRFD
jgi:tetratricopeptide (TPR) repeat protein